MHMKRVCAWCGRVLDGAVGEVEPEVTHGICETCKDHFLFEIQDEPMQEFLDHLPAPVLLVDDDVLVLAANSSACRVMGKELPSMVGSKGGEVMECANADSSGGCGRTLHCAGCVIRNTVAKTYEDGVSRLKVPAYQDRMGEDGIRRVPMLVTTEKVGNVVMLKVEEGKKP